MIAEKRAVTTLLSQGGVRKTLDLLYYPGDVVELRIPKVRGRMTVAGYFDDPVKLAAAARRYSGKVPGVYATLNPCKPDLLARADNRLIEWADMQTGDHDILCRRWLPVDFDPARPQGISSTDAEHDAALQHATACREYLDARGWPAPIFADSGNGAHLLYRIDLPNDNAGRDLVRACLHGLALLHGDDAVDVDTGNYNAARIWKLYGTLAAKGDNTADRPHRLARILERPENFEVVSREKLGTLAALVPEEPHRPTSRSDGQSLDLNDFLYRHGIEVRSTGPWNGGRKFVLEHCAWNSDHNDKSAYIVQFANGALAAGCHHNSCQGKGWRDLRDVFEPDRGRAGGESSSKPVLLPQQEASGGGRGPTQATRLVKLALAAGAELFHAPDDEPCATITVTGHSETWPLKAKGFRRWLKRLFYDAEEKAPGSQAVQDALGVLEGKALFDGPTCPVYTRLAQRDTATYLDLADAAWHAVEVTASGWRVVTRPPVKFRRPRGMAALPQPAAGGTLDDLRPFVNVASAADWRLLTAWLLAAMRPTGPYPILVLHGEQGAAKSTVARVLRALVDPNQAALRTVPRDERDLMIAASNGWCIVLDNLSHLSDWLSDSLCRIATGGGFATRELYSDAEEVLFAAQRPIILNGIEELATRADLLDRSLLLYLPGIPEHCRRQEAALWRDFEAARPRILGALLDVVSAAMRALPSVRLERLPRMADFARWACAAAPACGWTAADFIAAYAGVRQFAWDLTLEASPISEPLRALLHKCHGCWEGTAAELLEALEGFVDEKIVRRKTWPKTGRGLSNALRRIEATLRNIEITVERLREQTPARRRLIRVTRAPRTTEEF